MPGRFITFEGGEGCGKSTQIERLANRLRAEGHTVHQTREPGGTRLGEAIRNLLQHDEAGHGMCPETELLLFTAARAQIVRELITPALERGEIVLCDRFADSTTVYQGVARSIDPIEVAAVNQFACGALMPDLTVLIDLDPEIGLQRARDNRGAPLDRMEQEALAFHQQVRRGYLELAQVDNERFTILDGTKEIEALEKEIWNAVEPKLS
ncbi:dTMP kinase [Coraliomargarita sinensis]|uniref:Thymidylate kinase n=1 Tax=Coraliomargarita sinensis TaxID=2174842 RepID=A0A317ZI84_9BACT|nr:dTMP kinase [Coraliomargarita sinensis]PXA05315.1 dTMP kinase [Coraliomargarita sinensis]